MNAEPHPIAQAIETARNYLRSFGLSVILQAGLYPFRRAYHEGRSAAGGSRLRGGWAVLQKVGTLLSDRPQVTAQSAGTWTKPGHVLSWQRDDGESPVRVTLRCERARIEIAVLAPDLVRVRARPLSIDSADTLFPPPFSYAAAREDNAWPPVKVEVREEERTLTLRTDKLHCRVDLSQAAVSFHDPDGICIHGDEEGLSWDREAKRVSSARLLREGEHVYGLGEKTTPLDKRGVSFEMWNRDPPNYHPGDDPIYSNIPFLLGLVDRLEEQGRVYGYGLFVDHASRGRFDLTEGMRIEHGTDPGGDLHRSYFFYGPRLSDVLDRYTELTGRMAMLPLWALGYHQNRWSYTPEARVREIAGEFRRRRIPCEAIHLDIDYMDGFRCFTWDKERFPDPARLIADLHGQGFKVVTMIDPGIKVDADYWVYATACGQGVFCTYPDGKLFRGPVWPGECVFPRFHLAARARLVGRAVPLAVDAGRGRVLERHERAGGLWPRRRHHARRRAARVGGHRRGPREAHNVYGMQMARATVEGLRALRPDERPLVISRSVWAGSQRYYAPTGWATTKRLGRRCATCRSWS